MNVSLTPELENFVKQKVTAGMYNSASEVMREALRLLEEQDSLREMKVEALRRDIRDGVNELDGGYGSPLDMEKIKAKARTVRENRN
jgi:antitoxin ParD1/3/4